VGQSKQTFRVDEAAIVEVLYDAALEPDLLPAALHSFARSLNGSMGHALFLGIPSSIAASSGSQDIAASYAREWWKHDVATERGHSRRLHGLVTTAELTSPKDRASRSSSGNRWSGKPCHATGRTNRAIAAVPTDVVLGAVLAG
jgi:hypothetical protein